MSNKNNTTAIEAVQNTAAGVASQVIAEPSPEQIAEWKRAHGSVYRLEIESGEVCYLRQPGRKDLAAAQASSKKDPMKFNDSILVNCWLAGDTRIRTQDDLFLAASQQLDEILDFKTATIKKL